MNTKSGSVILPIESKSNPERNNVQLTQEEQIALLDHVFHSNEYLESVWDGVSESNDPKQSFSELENDLLFDLYWRWAMNNPELVSNENSATAKRQWLNSLRGHLIDRGFLSQGFVITTNHNGIKCFLQLSSGVAIWNTDKSKADEFSDRDLAEAIAKSVSTPNRCQASCQETEPFYTPLFPENRGDDAGLLQVSLLSPSGKYCNTITEMKQALNGTGFTLDIKQTTMNNMIAMVRARDDAQTEWLMHQGVVILCNGCQMEIPTP